MPKSGLRLVGNQDLLRQKSVSCTLESSRVVALGMKKQHHGCTRQSRIILQLLEYRPFSTALHYIRAQLHCLSRPGLEEFWCEKCPQHPFHTSMSSQFSRLESKSMQRCVTFVWLKEPQHFEALQHVVLQVWANVLSPTGQTAKKNSTKAFSSMFFSKGAIGGCLALWLCSPLLWEQSRALYRHFMQGCTIQLQREVPVSSSNISVALQLFCSGAGHMHISPLVSL